MITFNFAVKSGTCGYSSPDNCDYVLFKDINAPVLPRIGEKITFFKNGDRTFLITDISHDYVEFHHKVTSITVYGIPVDGKPVE